MFETQNIRIVPQQTQRFGRKTKINPNVTMNRNPKTNGEKRAGL